MEISAAGSTSNKLMAYITDDPSGRLMDTYHQLISTTGHTDDVTDVLVRTLHHQAGQESVTVLLGNGDIGLSTATKEAFATFSQEINVWRETLERASEAVRSLHTPDLMRSLSEAKTALLNGMRTSGRDRTENLRDALRLLSDVQSSPVGGRDYLTRFNVGWLQWKLQEGLNEAEEAFYQAARLSAGADQLFQAYSLLHLGYMQYLRGQMDAAYETIRRALTHAPSDAVLLFEAARYAARTGHEADALDYLGQCFELSPLVFAFAFGEEDFAAKGLDARITAFAATRKEQAEREINREATRWARATEQVREAEKQAGVELTIADDLLATAPPSGTSSDYFSLLARQSQTHGKAEALRSHVLQQLDAQVSSLNEQIERPTRQIEKALQDRKLWQQNLKQTELEAQQAGFPLTEVKGMALLKLRMGKLEHRYNMARMTYEAAKQNLEQTEAQIKEQVPTLHENIRRLKERRDQIESARAWLDSQEL